MYWQKLPRHLQYSKTVILHRGQNTSWGFSITAGSDGSIHVLFIAPNSPAAKDTKIK